MARTGSMEISALGRPLNLGTLYDARNDRLVPGISLWSNDDIKIHTRVSKQNKTSYSVKASETISDKTNMLDVSASVKASFLCGLVEVEGSAKYLEQKTSSSSQCRVTLKYSETTEHKELNIAELKVLNSEVDKTDATHVVVEVTYGADAFLEFEETASDDAKKREIQGKLNVMINKIPKISLEGKGSVTLNNDDKEKVRNFSCKFYGDFHLRELPANYEEAVKVYKELPSLLGEGGNAAVPVKVWLYPLCKLSNTDSKLKKTISESLVSDLEEVMDDFHKAMVRTNNLLERSNKVQAKDIVTKLEQFQSSLEDSITEFKQKMATLIPAIRGGSMQETALKDLLRTKDASGFSGVEMQQWLGEKETEINTITQYINKIQDRKIKCEGYELDSFLRSPDVSDGFVLCFTSLKYEEPYLNRISRRSTQQQNPKPWYNREDAIKALQDSFDIFEHAPSKSRVISFIKDDKYPGASVRWYRNITLKNAHVTCVMDLFACELTLDEKTAQPCISLTDGNKKATNVYQTQSYPDNPERFDSEYSVLCAEPLPAGRSYWECEWSLDKEYVCIGVAYNTMHRKGSYAWVGGNDKSWSLYCKYNYYYVYNNNSCTVIPNPPPGTRRVGVYLDREAGTLAFYSIDKDTHKSKHDKVPWYKFTNINFIDEDLYAGFWIGTNSSVSLI